MTVEGKCGHEREAKGEKTHQVERFYGGFCRRFTLPENTDPKSIRAECPSRSKFSNPASGCQADASVVSLPADAAP